MSKLSMPLNNYFRQSTGVIKKALVDGQPDIPSVIMQGFWSNLYNATLSAFATPIKAVVSAGALLIERPGSYLCRCPDAW